MPDEKLPLIVHPGSGLARVGPQGGRIVAEMVSGALALSRTAGALGPRFRIADHEFCEPDYQQILLWAKAADIPPEILIERLFDDQPSPPINVAHEWEERFLLGSERRRTHFENGRIVSVLWRYCILPVKSFEWVESLAIKRFNLSLLNVDEEVCIEFEPRLPDLEELLCKGYQYKGAGLIELDLTGVPKLKKLECGGNRITELDLSATPNLTFLACSSNDIEELDLLPVPHLLDLHCSYNPLAHLHLEKVPKLRRLNCATCEIESLNLFETPDLEELWCAQNNLSTLNLAGLESLEYLNCGENELETLDLSETPNLTQLVCHGNSISELDIRPLHSLADLYYNNNQTRLIQRPDQNF